MGKEVAEQELTRAPVWMALVEDHDLTQVVLNDDLLVVDLDWDRTALPLLREARRAAPGLTIAVLSRDAGNTLWDAVANGADAFLMKRPNAPSLDDVLDQLACSRWMCPMSSRIP